MHLQSLKSTCGGEYVNVDTNNKICTRYIEAYSSVGNNNNIIIIFWPCYLMFYSYYENSISWRYEFQCVSGIFAAHILERNCAFVSPKSGELVGRRFLDEKSEFFLPVESELPTIGCRVISQLAPFLQKKVLIYKYLKF